MATYVMLTRLSPDAITEPDSIKELGRRVIDKLNAECPEANWLSSYATLGPYDYLDLFEAPDNETAAKVAEITTLQKSAAIAQRMAALRSAG